MAKLNIIITGSTGMVGRGVLLECMDHPEVESILLINRNPIEIRHPKIKEVLLRDFFKVESIRENMRGYNAFFYCLGITSVGASEEAYKRIMYDLTMLYAKEVLMLNPGIIFCFVSGAGTDSSEKGNTMWARVKGKTENDLMKLGFDKAYMFRPGHIQPKRGIRSRTGWYNLYYTILGPFYFILKWIPKYVTDTMTLGKAMINAAAHGYPKNILESVDINIAGK